MDSDLNSNLRTGIKTITITKDATVAVGDVEFSTPMPNVSYSVIVTGDGGDYSYVFFPLINNKTVNGFRINLFPRDGSFKGNTSNRSVEWIALYSELK